MENKRATPGPSNGPAPSPEPVHARGGPTGQGPLARYAREVECARLHYDVAQANAAGAFQELYERLQGVAAGAARPGGLRGLLASRRPEPVPGIYLWGGVGRGKTWIMNAFFDALPFASKRRVHFHAFMQYVHGELKALRRHRDPLVRVAGALSTDTRIICFDEFQVSDITDAMLLGRLLGELFARGVTLVATSNVEPDRLYWGGLQRTRFLPAIELLKTRTRVLHLDGAVDYRLRTLERADIYCWPLGEEAEQSLALCFEALNPAGAMEDAVLDVAGRRVPARRAAEGVAWFEFDALCATARSSVDYIEIAQRFHSVLLANVPVLDDERPDAALRFVHLVDELYQRRVNLIVSAAAPPGGLYAGRRLSARFARTRSRLEEMQSLDYLSQAHLV